jgi:hypothetical protein
MTKNLSFVLGGIALVLLLVIIYQNFVPSGFSGSGADFATKDEAGEDVINFIKENLTAPDTEISLTEINDMSGVYEVKFNIMGQDERVFVTKDAKLLFLQSFDMQPPEPQKFTKTEKPEVDLFVMAFCPFGNQAEEILIPVAELLGDKANIELRYIIYNDYATGYPEYCLDPEKTYCSMHGIQEINQGIRELCVQKYQKDKLWDFVKAINTQSTSEDVDSKWEAIAQNMGIDVAKIKTCQQDEGIALLTQELNLTHQEYPVQDPAEHQGSESQKVSGSPTLVINGMIFDGERSINGYKEAICSAFINPPAECEQELTESVSSSDGSCE